MLYLNKFINEHKNWEDLLTNKPYCLHIARDDGYILFKYDMIESDFSLPEVKEARGIIFRESDFKCVCHPFNKFHNAEEGNSDLNKIDWSSASVQEKVDGSLIKLWFDNGWHISTNGTINAFKAEMTSGVNTKYKTFGELFVGAILASYNFHIEESWGLFDKDYTYMFEVVSPYNQVVIKYEKEDVYLLGCRNMITELEEDAADKSLGKLFKMPRRYNLNSYEAVREAADKLNKNCKGSLTDEGFVVCDKAYNRIKVKSLDYVKCHHLRNNGLVTWERLVDVIISNSRDDFSSYISDYDDKLDLIEKKIKEFKDTIKNIIIELKPETFESRKDYAMKVLTYKNKYHQFLFRYDTVNELFNKVTARKWVELLELE